MGPTASGKSALALVLAERLDGEIINADSVQVYRDLRVLTARPSHEEEARAPHHLYGFVDAAIRYSAGAWLRAMTPILDDVRARGRLPIVVGGTGLYFKALTHGLVDIPAADEALRQKLRERARSLGLDALHAELAASDPEAAGRISPTDAPRILRALEVLEATGVSISQHQSATRPVLTRAEWRGVVLAPERVDLYASIERRFDAMMPAGALEEVSALAARNLDPSLPAMKAHGAPALMAHVRGELTLAEAVALAKRDTRRYAKRQFTWIAHQMPGWTQIRESSLPVRLELAERALEAPV